MPGFYDKDIARIVAILRKETQKWQHPVVTEYSINFKNPFYVLISCILSLRTQDQTTRLASRRLFSLVNTPQKILKLSTKQIEKAIYPVGFYHTKAKNIKYICRDLLEKFNTKVPNTLEDLLSLKGVGRKTANLVLTEGFNLPGVCVDTHVHRISNRLGFVKTKIPFETEFALRKKLAPKFWKEYNPLLVKWGQNICKPVSPLCSICKINQYCLKIGVTIHR